MKSHVLQVKLGLMQGLTRAAFGVRHAWREGAVERKGDQLSEPEADSLRVDFGIELCDGWIPELECVPVVLDALRHARCWLPLAGLWDREVYSAGVAIHGLSLVSWEVGCSASFSVSAQSSSDMSPQSNGSLLLRTISREECGSPRMPQTYFTDDRMARRCATSTLPAIALLTGSTRNRQLETRKRANSRLQIRSNAAARQWFRSQSAPQIVDDLLQINMLERRAELDWTESSTIKHERCSVKHARDDAAGKARVSRMTISMSPHL